MTQTQWGDFIFPDPAPARLYLLAALPRRGLRPQTPAPQTPERLAHLARPAFEDELGEAGDDGNRGPRAAARGGAANVTAGKGRGWG
ncbi:hypothetical protein GCM10009837_31710 [Streptomyces durmitorensis]